MEELIKNTRTNPTEKILLQSRLIAHLRSKYNKLLVKYNDLKHNSDFKEKSLNRAIKHEKMKRVRIQEEKLEKRSQLLSELENRDKKIVKLQLDLF